ncbi:MAG: glycosyltransferase family 39 protein [Candidatus Roizmanbacteria bacterium]
MNIFTRYRTALVLTFCVCISIFLHTYQYRLPSLNEDEAAQGYNTYSVLKTGRDEYGKFPIRYLSFGENKLPLTGFLSAPFIALFGLNEHTVRLPVHLIGIAMPLLMYQLLISLFRKRSIGYVGALLTSTNVWIHTLSRHQHEAVVLLAIVMLYIIISISFKKKQTMLKGALLAVLYFLGLYTYHSAKILMPTLALWTFTLVWNDKKYRLMFLVSIIIATGLFLLTEYLAPNNRVGQLSYFTSSAFIYAIEDGRQKGGSLLLYNKVSYAIYTVIHRLFYYLSPYFLIWGNDANYRYGDVHISLITYLEYFGAVLGLIWCWVKKQPYRIALIGLISVSVVPAIASMSSQTNTRSYSLVLPIILLASYGLVELMSYVTNRKIRAALFLVFALIHLSSLYTSWNYYFYKYFTDPQTQSATQAGMTEVTKIAWSLEKGYKTIYVSNRFGQAYIYMLMFGGPVDPRKYQQIAKTQPYNEYGFWEQPTFTSKFIFHVPTSEVHDSVVILPSEEVQKYPYLASRSHETIASVYHQPFYIYRFD